MEKISKRTKALMIEGVRRIEKSTIYENNILLIIATIILGIGHIGIHINHKKEVN